MNKPGYLLIGWISVGLGLVGALLPLMPTTVFLLVAAWAFAKSSPRRHQWLRGHPRFGHLIRAWEQHRAMPARAKRMAWIALAASWSVSAAVFGPFSLAAILGGMCIAGVAIYIGHIPLLERKPAPDSPSRETQRESGPDGGSRPLI